MQGPWCMAQIACRGEHSWLMTRCWSSGSTEAVLPTDWTWQRCQRRPRRWDVGLLKLGTLLRDSTWIWLNLSWNCANGPRFFSLNPPSVPQWIKFLHAHLGSSHHLLLSRSKLMQMIKILHMAECPTSTSPFLTVEHKIRHNFRNNQSFD